MISREALPDQLRCSENFHETPISLSICRVVNDFELYGRMQCAWRNMGTFHLGIIPHTNDRKHTKYFDVVKYEAASFVLILRVSNQSPTYPVIGWSYTLATLPQLSHLHCD